MSRPLPRSTTYGSSLSGEVAVIAAQAVAALPWKAPCRVATTGNVTISTALNAGDSIDSVTLAAGDRVLVWQQSTGSQNGIYVVAATPARAVDFDTDAEIRGALIYVIAGSTYAGTIIVNTNTSAVTVDTTALTFSAFTTAPAGPAGGDLSGTYPNPSVLDDSHSHTIIGGTLPAMGGPLLIGDDHSTPIVFADLLLTEEGDDLLYADSW